MSHLPTSSAWAVGLVATGAAAVTASLYLLYTRRPRVRAAAASVLQTPHPDWRLGQKQISPYAEAGVAQFDPAALSAAECYPLVISSVVPRPIAFISSLSAEGVGNLAPFSYFVAVSHDPPCLAVSICRSAQRGGHPKDTAQNILETGEFVVNIISEWFIESANYTCAPFERGINEMEVANLTPVPSVKVKPPRVEESAVQMECQLRHHYNICNRSGNVHATVFIVEVVMFHISNAVLTSTPSGRAAVDPQKLQPMSRLGGNTYGRSSSLFDLPRPDRTV